MICNYCFEKIDEKDIYFEFPDDNEFRHFDCQVDKIRKIQSGEYVKCPKCGCENVDKIELDLGYGIQLVCMNPKCDYNENIKT